MRHINAAGLDLIREFEGCRLEAYKDAVGVWTIGYGSTGPHVRPGMVISQAKADRLLRADLERFEQGIEALVTVPLTDNEFAALVCWSYNVGLGAAESSTLIRVLNEGDYDAVPVELLRWNMAGGRVLNGLIRRRKAEAALWSTQPAPEAGFFVKESTMKTTATKAHASAVTVVIMYLVARYLGVGDAPPVGDLLGALQVLGEGLVAGGIAWLAAYLPANKPKGE